MSGCSSSPCPSLDAGIQEIAEYIYYSEDENASLIISVAGDRDAGIGPYVQAVAVDKQGKILFVGSNSEAMKYASDTTTKTAIGKDQIMLPGFIEPHIHEFYPPLFYKLPIVSGDISWDIPGVEQYQVYGNQAFLDQLDLLLQKMDDQGKPKSEVFIIIGYQNYFHGDIDQSILNTLEQKYNRPVVVLQKSTHAAWLGSMALAKLIPPGKPLQHKDQCDYAAGHFWEEGCVANVIPEVLITLYENPNSVAELTDIYLRWLKYLHSKGLTTTCDMMAQFGFDINRPTKPPEGSTNKEWEKYSGTMMFHFTSMSTGTLR